MKPIETAYINALLADASYRSLTRGMTTEQLTVELRDRLTETQAAYLAANFTVVTSIETPNTIHSELGTGFDAVVWQIKAGSELAGPNNVNAGKIFVSMRGTQGGTDIADDGTLATRGIPYDQIRDMVNWWLKNTAAVTNTEVQQIKVQETVVSIVPPIIVKTFALDVPTTGTGLLNELDGIAGVNGLGNLLSPQSAYPASRAPVGVVRVDAGARPPRCGSAGSLIGIRAIANNDHLTLGFCKFDAKNRNLTAWGSGCGLDIRGNLRGPGELRQMVPRSGARHDM